MLRGELSCHRVECFFFGGKLARRGLGPEFFDPPAHLPPAQVERSLTTAIEAAVPTQSTVLFNANIPGPETRYLVLDKLVFAASALHRIYLAIAEEPVFETGALIKFRRVRFWQTKHFEAMRSKPPALGIALGGHILPQYPSRVAQVPTLPL